MQIDRRTYVKGLALSATLAAFAAPFPALSGTFYNAVGNAEVVGAQAAAALNQGLGHFHMMLAFIENEDFENAQQQKNMALAELERAAGLFEKAVEISSPEDLPLKNSNAEFLRQYARLLEFAREMGIESPLTERKLSEIAVNATRRFASNLREMPMANLKQTRTSVHTVIRVSLNLQDIGLIASNIWAS